MEPWWSRWELLRRGTAGGTADFSGTGTINTLTANTGTSTSILGGWATFGNGANWAASAGTGTAAGNITALASYTANTWAAGNNTDMTTAGTVTNLATNSVRFNTATPVTVTVSGTDTINTGGILVTPTATAAATIFTGGTLTTGTNTDLVVNHFGTNTATIASIIASNGTGGLVKAGGGVLILGNVTNTYNGNTVVGAGTLRLGGANNVSIPNGAGKGDLIINAGATFDLNGFDETVNGLSGFGTITSGINSNKTITVGDNNASSTFSGVILNGTSTANVLTKIGTGTLTLNNLGANTYTGTTNINGGGIAIAVPNALANNTVVNVNSANGLKFDTTIPTISGLGGNSTFALQTQPTSALPNAPVQLTVGNNNNNGANYSGALTGSGSVIKIGSGVQTLSGNNTNAGGLAINGGTLVLSGNNSGAAGSVFVNSGVLQINSPNSLWGASGQNLVVSNGANLSFTTGTGNPVLPSFGSLSAGLSRVAPGSTGTLALQTDGSTQLPVSENLDFSASGPGGALDISLGAMLTGNAGLGTAPVQYTGVITPNANTFRLGGGGGRLILPNSATMAGANGLHLFGGSNTGGMVFLTGAYGFTGGTFVNGGTTVITNLAAGGTASSLGAGGAAASNLVLNGGTLQYVGTGSSTDRLFTLSAGPTNLDSSGSGPVNFTNTGAVEFLNAGNRTFTLQGNNTAANTLAAAFADSYNVAGNSGVLANGITALQKNGNGTWVLSGSNTFSGGVTISNGVLGFTSAASIGAPTLNGPASVQVNAGGAVALMGSLQTGIQATLQRVSPLSTGTVALTADSAEAINLDGGSAGAVLPNVSLGAYGNVTYTGSLIPFGSIYRLGGGGGTLTMPNGGLTGPRQVIIGGGGPGAGLANNANLNGAVVLGGSSDYSGGTILSTGAILSATSLTALGTGPLKFQGGFYRAIDTTDITLASDGVSAREIRVGFDSQTGATANIDVANGVNLSLSKAFGMPVTLGSNQGQVFLTKWGAGSLTLAGINLGASNGTNTVATNSGTITIERGTLSLAANPTNYNGLIQIGSNNGGVGTLKLAADNVFGGTIAQFGSASVIDTYSGSVLDLNGKVDTIRLFRGTGSIINTGASTANLTMGTNNEIAIIMGNLVGDFTLTRGGTVSPQFGTGSNNTSTELWNPYNTGFTGRLVANVNGIRIRSAGTLGSTTEAFKADKITLGNGGTLYTTANNAIVGANHGITLNNGGMLWSYGNGSLLVNSPISGTGGLTIADDPGVIILGGTNTYTGGTIIDSNAAGRGQLMIGVGGTAGTLPAGDVIFNSGAGAARLFINRADNVTISNTLVGPGVLVQIGGGTTTLNGNNQTGQPTQIAAGRLIADFSTGNQPIGSGTALQIGGGGFEYVAPAGDNTLRLGALTLTTPVSAGSTVTVGGGIGDTVVQSTYGGSGAQSLLFANVTRGTGGVTVNFITSGGTNGTTNSIGFLPGASPAVNTVMGAAYYFGSDFAAVDGGYFVRPVNYGVDANSSPLNTLIANRYAKLTSSLVAQPAVNLAGLHLAGSGTNFTLNAGATLTTNGNPGALFKTGGGTSIIGGGAGATVNNNAGELIARAEGATDVLQIDIPIAGAGQLTKSGNGQLVLTAANTTVGAALITNGNMLVTGNGVFGTVGGSGEIRISTVAGQAASVTIDSATASIITGTGASSFRIGEVGPGTLTQSAGTVTASNYLVLGESLGATGTYTMSGGTLNVKTNNAGTPNLVVGRAGTGVMSISGSSVVNVRNGAQIQLGAGTFNSGQFQAVTPFASVQTGVGTITQTGGAVNVDVNNGSYQGPIGGVILGVDGAGTYNLNGGTLTTPILARGNGTAQFNLGGGTLKAASPVATLNQSIFNVDIPLSLTGTGAGRGAIDTNGQDVAITGALTGAGGFVKSGTGTLSVLGSGSNFSGGTTIGAASGTIVASGTSLGSGNVDVGAGSTLQIQGVQTGLLAKFYLATTTAINPATSVNTAQLTEFTTLNSFNSFTAGKPLVAVESTAARGKVSVNYLDLGGANGNTALPPQIASINGAGSPFVADLRGVFNAATAGEYTFQTRSDDASILYIDGVPVLDNNRSQGQTVRTGTINLTAGPHDILIGYYQGAGGGGFSVGVTLPGQGQSFLLGSELNMANALLTFGNNTLAVGSLSGSGNTQLSSTRSDGTVNLGDLTFGSDNTNAAYSGNIQGEGSVTKVGTGTQTLAGTNNTYTQATNIQGGTLLMGGNNVLPDTAALNLSTGATLATGGFSDNTGALSVNGAASIDTGAGTGTLNFASVTAWADMLNIWNYTGAAWTPGSDKITFTNTAGIDFNNVNFYAGAQGDFGSLVGTGGGGLIGNELVPVPEPTAIMSLLALFGLAGYKERRRFFHFRK